jgi:hypothetical protein
MIWTIWDRAIAWALEHSAALGQISRDTTLLVTAGRPAAAVAYLAGVGLVCRVTRRFA